MEEIMLKIDNISKKYKLGQIGGTTLRDELQRKKAKLRNEEDPTKKIGSKQYKNGEEFLALDGISFEVKKGERVGIIGHNGAGKSTLLKLISRVTAPTSGTISLNGRVASMLEVGTGFHPELTGRENIYMNGAILGMTKKEIDSKIEDIIEFSECRQFIDTPVKRYSSGMCVKLAFSVAAHLDSEIIIMDEVLAVGDFNFQQKCIDKMNEIAINDNKTILYVSHNMNTVKELCNRCLVFEKGHIIYDGNVNDSIDIYKKNIINKNDVLNEKRMFDITNECLFNKLNIKDNNIKEEENLLINIEIISKIIKHNCCIRLVLYNDNNFAIGMSYTHMFDLEIGENKLVLEFSTKKLSFGNYYFDIILLEIDNNYQKRHDILLNKLPFSIIDQKPKYNVGWNKSWGNVYFGETRIIKNGKN